MAISRAECFSPNSVDKDAAILECVVSALRHRGYDIETVSETELADGAGASAYVHMARGSRALSVLRRKELAGSVVVNATAGVELCCNRRRLTERLIGAGIPVPPASGPHGHWLKRADGVAQSESDVQFVSAGDDISAARERMRSQGVGDILVCAHIPGDLVKFYGVRGTGFFHACYPGDDGCWKFSDERRNGIPRHYPFDSAALHRMAERAAAAAGVDVYGGDCVIGSDGSACIIDFNDWPSFSRCRAEAAAAIAGLVAGRMACGF